MDLGWHQLRDVPEPVQVFQLGDGRFPPLPIVAESRTNLLAAASRMIGRDEDLTEARAALTESRLVTLTAAGGTGKTRLALAIGEDEYLDVDGEHVIRLRPLDSHGVSSDAVELFIERAVAVDSALKFDVEDRSTVAVLCEHLDGSPRRSS